MHKKILLLSLQTFSTTGGIQKMSRTLAYSLFRLAQQEHWNLKLFSLYDRRYDLMDQYLPPANYVGFNNNRFRFGFASIKEARGGDVVILNHINLSVIGIIIKLLNRRSNIWMIAHGIEVWRPINFVKRAFLNRYCDKIICVSKFTKEQMIIRHRSDPDKCVVLNNAVDPFIQLPDGFDKPEYLLNRYSLTPNTQVIFTLTRLASSEQYKGYEQVIKAIAELKKTTPDIKYILAGQYDAVEELRIKTLIDKCGVSSEVILTGFIEENELTDHFLLADLFVLPSKKEGFGIVFVEALACGLPVICGNADGSTDAIRDGKLGTAINVNDVEILQGAILRNLNTPLTFERRNQLQKECLRHFEEKYYRESLKKMLTSENAV